MDICTSQFKIFSELFRCPRPPSNSITGFQKQYLQVRIQGQVTRSNKTAKAAPNDDDIVVVPTRFVSESSDRNKRHATGRALRIDEIVLPWVWCTRYDSIGPETSRYARIIKLMTFLGVRHSCNVEQCVSKIEAANQA